MNTLDNPLSGERAKLETDLAELPDQVSGALYAWRRCTAEREKIEALLYIQFRTQDTERTTTEIKALIHANGERYKTVLDEAMAESTYTNLMERLLAAKKLATLRTAF